MGKNQQKLQLAEALKDLQSGNTVKISAALKKIEHIGDASVLPQLVDLLRTADQSTAKQVLDLLADIQDQNACEILISLIQNEKDDAVRQRVLSTIWNSKLDYSDYLAEFVSLATEGDLLQALDCLTIIENLSGPFEEHQLLESQLYLKEYLESTAPKEERKNAIISDIAYFIKEQNEGIDADLLLD